MSKMHAEKAVAENNHLPRVSKRNVFPLLQLPRELRDGIYRHSITAGNLGILRISKTVNEEASQLLSKHAVLRVNAGFVDRTNWSDLGPGAEVSIQRVEFRLNESSDALPYDYDIITRFAHRQVVRESCIVTINYGKDGSAPYHIERSLLFLSLGTLTGFKSVVVRVVVERHDASEFEGFLTEEKFRDIFPYDSRLVSHHKESYQNVQLFLELSLGPAKFDCSVEGHYLEFHPLDPIPDDWSPAFDLDD
ncbi:MAG: hypothetical protein Q9175_005451 [Cornicularia normoerica]